MLKIQGVIFADFVSVESRGVSGFEWRFHGQVYHGRDSKSSNSTNDVRLEDAKRGSTQQPSMVRYPGERPVSPARPLVSHFPAVPH